MELDFLLVLTFLVAFLSGILGGIGGGGSGLITMPYYVWIGLPPAQALATGKFTSLGNCFGAFTAFQGTGFVNKKLVFPFTIITAVCALASAYLVPQIDPDLFKKIIAILLLVLIPTLFIQKDSLQPGVRSKVWTTVGFIAYSFFSFMQTLFGTGLGSILILVLMFLFGLTTIEANATRRVSQSVQAIILFVLLGFQGFVVWSHGVTALLGSGLGTHFGTKIALKKGAEFIKAMLAITMFFSGIALLWD